MKYCTSNLTKEKQEMYQLVRDTKTDALYELIKKTDDFAIIRSVQFGLEISVPGPVFEKDFKQVNP